jgi:hypothetical protein
VLGVQGRYDLIRAHRAIETQLDAVRPLLGSQALSSRSLTPNDCVYVKITPERGDGEREETEPRPTSQVGKWPHLASTA